MTHTLLRCHPDTPCPNIERFEVLVDWDEPRALRLRYLIRGDMAGLIFAVPGEPKRADDLWKHSCMEVFIKVAGQQGYWEFNFSPSNAWALYRFPDYRKGRTTPEPDRPPRILTRRTSDSFELEARVKLDSLQLSAGSPLLALSAVVESGMDGLSYWALRHPEGAPDFHHPHSFALESTPEI